MPPGTDLPPALPLSQCAALLLQGTDPRFHGLTPSGDPRMFLGPLPPIGHIFEAPDGTRYQILSHFQPDPAP